MSEEATTEAKRRRPGVPKYFYWGRSPPKLTSYQVKPLSNQQRRFKFVISAFTVAKILAIIGFLALLFGRL